MRKIKGLKYCINSTNSFKGIPFFRKLSLVTFTKENEKIAEFKRKKNLYSIDFGNSEKIKLSLKDRHGEEFKISDLKENQSWSFFNPNKNFSIFSKSPDYLIESKNVKIELKSRNSSLIYSIDKKVVGRIEEKKMFFGNGTYRIDVFDDNYEKILISACCIELIRYHILKVYETGD